MGWRGTRGTSGLCWGVLSVPGRWPFCLAGFVGRGSTGMSRLVGCGGFSLVPDLPGVAGILSPPSPSPGLPLGRCFFPLGMEEGDRGQTLAVGLDWGARAVWESLGAAPPAGQCFTLSAALRGLGVGYYYCGGKIFHQVPWHMVAAHPLPGEGRYLPRAGMLLGGQRLHTHPRIPPPSPAGSPRTPRCWIRQLPAT